MPKSKWNWAARINWREITVEPKNIYLTLCILFDSVDATEVCDDLDQQIVCCNNYLGNFYQEMGRYERAYGCYVTALTRAQEMFPESDYPQGHPLLSATIQNIATHLWLLGDTEVAAAYYQEALGMNERLYPSDAYPRGHRLLMAACMAWGNVLVREGRHEEAEAYLRRAEQIAMAQYPASAYPDGHDELVKVWRSLGRLERAKLECDAAATCFEKSLQSYRQRHAETCTNGCLPVAMMLAELGRTYCVAGDYGRAERYYEQSLAIRRSLFSVQDYPQGHPSLANALRDFGSAHHLAGQYEQAFRLFMESARMEHAIAESFFGGGSEATLLNLAAHRFQSFDYLLDAWRHTDRPASEAYQYVWLRRGFVPRLIAQRNRVLRRLANEGAVAGLEQYLEVRRDLSRTLLVSAHQEIEGDTAPLKGIRELNARKEELEHQLARQLGPIKSDMASQMDGPSLLAQSLPRDAVLIDYVRYSRRTADSLVPVADRPERARLLAFVVAHGRAVVCIDLGEADEIDALVSRCARPCWQDVSARQAIDCVTQCGIRYLNTFQPTRRRCMSPPTAPFRPWPGERFPPLPQANFSWRNMRLPPCPTDPSYWNGCSDRIGSNLNLVSSWRWATWTTGSGQSHRAKISWG